MNVQAKIEHASSPRYETDGYGWALAQADLLRRRRVELIDWDNVIEEIESMGRSQENEYESHLIRVLLHMLKWDAQPERRGMSWWLSIMNGRDDAARILKKNPSLKPLLDAIHEEALGHARRKAMLETGIDRAVFDDFMITRSDAFERHIPRPESD